MINKYPTPYPTYPSYSSYPKDDRQFFFPFLTGALVGGAAIGLTRPRPIYNVAPYPSQPPYRPNAPYSYYSYGGYIPGPYPRY